MFESALHKAKVYKQQGNSFFNSKDYERALQHYTLSIKAFPLMQVYSNRAMAYINIQRYQQALEDCECALKMDKTHLKTILRKAKCLIYLLRIDQATNFLDISLKQQNKQSSKELIQLTNKIKESIDNYKTHRKTKDYIQARDYLNESYSIMKNNAVIIVSIIQCQARINKIEAMKLLNSMNQTIDQSCFIYWYLRAIIQLSFGFKDRAKSYLKQTLRYFTTKPLKQIEKKLLVSFTKEQLLQLLESISACQILIKDAYSLLRQQKHKQVIKKLNIVLDADSISSEQRIKLLFMRSRCFKLTKQKPKQLNDLNKLLRMQPNHLQALQARIQLYENEKKYGLALRDAQRLHTITNKHNDIVQKLANFVNSKQQQKLDYYETLGIDRTATQDDIKKAYKQLAIIYHPDKNRCLNEQQQKFAKEKFKQIKKAQVCLIDPYKRQLYDHHNCDPQELDQQTQRKSEFFDIFSSFGAFGGTFESFFTNSQAGTFRPGSSNARNNFQSFFPGDFSFRFTPKGFPF